MEGTPTTPSTTLTTPNEQHIMAATPSLKRPKSRPTPYSKPSPILLSAERRARKRKSLSWQSDDKIQKVHYFEYIADERINVTKTNNEIENANASGSTAGSSLNANPSKPLTVGGGKLTGAAIDPIRRSNDKNESDKVVEYSPWRSLVLIDFSPELPSPGWQSVERFAQAERETYVLGAIDLPGQPSTLDEPCSKSGSPEGNNCEQSSKDGNQTYKSIPLDNPEGMYTEYPNMYSSDIVNGVRVPTDNPEPAVQNIAPFCNQQQSHLIPGPFQVVYPTPSPFNFQGMRAQAFQPQAQIPLHFTFQQHQQLQQQIQQQQPQQQFQNQPQLQPTMPFATQQPALTGPIMPWLSYPFNQVSENSHAHLFRRPTT